MMISEIADSKNLYTAFEHLQTKPNSCGIDGQMLYDLKDYLDINIKTIQESILTGNFEFGLVKLESIVSKKGKIRKIAKYNSIDRLVLRAIYQIFNDAFNNAFSKYSFAYQKSKGISVAVMQATDFINEGYNICADIDLVDFFDNISHTLLIDMLKNYEIDEKVILLINKFLKCKTVIDCEISTKNKGIIQGSALSPLLSNIYLNDADHFFEANKIHFCRFADDIRIFCKNYDECANALKIVCSYLEQKLYLPINKKKTYIGSVYDKSYLGYNFLNLKNGKTEAKKEIKKRKTDYPFWNRSAIQKTYNEYHIVGDGILTRKDFSILFENENNTFYIPIECTDCINIYSRIICSPDFLDFISQKKIIINYFSKYGEFQGSFIPKFCLENSSLIIQQSQFYLDENLRLQLAVKFAYTAAHNIRETLKYYSKHNSNSLFSETINNITAMMNEERNVASITELLLLEARIRENYYACFNVILPYDDFFFSKRSKRPPKDAINAMISFGNTLLYRRVAKEIYKSRLDIRFGFLHSTTNRRETLNLDISEIFRPIIVDRVIFTLINKHMINESAHFDYSDDRCFLNNAGKKIFIREFEDKMNQHIKVNEKHYSYNDLIVLEIKKLIKQFEKNESYKPFKYFM